MCSCRTSSALPFLSGEPNERDVKEVHTAVRVYEQRVREQ